MESRYLGYYVALALFVVILGAASFSKPTCDAGTVPVLSFGSGWYCAAGYKPG